MKRQVIKNPYNNISRQLYEREKRRLQIALLKLQEDIVANNRRVIITLDGRDAAGKGSTIRRLTQNLMSKHFRVVELGIPTKKESKYWFKRYQDHFPEPGELVFFDRSWYNRALIEPTMGYCSEQQYKYFMRKVLDWEHKHLANGIEIIKIYLSVNRDTQLLRFNDRKQDQLKFWKFSKNDDEVRGKWDVFTKFKEQMFEHTSSEISPWVIVNSNRKMESILCSMLYIVNHIAQGKIKFKPLKSLKKKKVKKYSLNINNVDFESLTKKQYNTLKKLLAEVKNVAK